MFSMDRFRILVISVALAAGPRVLLAADKGDAVKGKAVFQQCGVCHRADSDEKKIGPGLKGLFKKAKLKNGQPVSESTVRTRIDEGGGGIGAALRQKALSESGHACTHEMALQRPLFKPETGSGEV